MKRAEDLVRVREKPYNSILPYLRAKQAKQAEKAEAVKKQASHKTDKKEETYRDAIHSIVTGEE